MIENTKNKIFNLSLQKNGTKSFHLFCKNKNLKSFHWLSENPLNFEQYSYEHFENLEQVSKVCLDNNTLDSCYEYYKNNFFENYDSFCDFPIPLFYDKLLKEYKNEIFIIFYRNVDNWIRSVRKHYSIVENNHFFDILMYHQLTGIKKKNINDYSDFELTKIYNNHLHNVFKTSIQENINLHVINLNSNSTTFLLNNIIKTKNDGLFGKYS
jgi:hypothetical protein